MEFNFRPVKSLDFRGGKVYNEITVKNKKYLYGKRSNAMEERRKSKRLELESKIIIKSINDPEEQHEAIIDIMDASKTGVGFNCDLPLTIGTIYEAYLTIWTKEVLHTFIEIVRIVKKENTFNYGATFVGMPGMDASRISIYDMINTELEKQGEK